MLSLPGVLLLSKLSRRQKHSSAEILPSQNFFRSSESAGIFKSFRKEEMLIAICGSKVLLLYRFLKNLSCSFNIQIGSV